VVAKGVVHVERVSRVRDYLLGPASRADEDYLVLM
jgi:hypothetical protein